MLKTLSINNDRYYSHNKKRKTKKKTSNNLYILPINNNYIKEINPIKLIPRNNTFSIGNPQFNNIDSNSNSNKYNMIKKSNLSKSKSKCNTIDTNKSSHPKNKRNKKNSNYNIIRDNVFDLDRSLTQKEKKFTRNISQNIMLNKKINDKLINNVEMLENEINNKYQELSKSKYNFYNVNKNIFQTIYNDRRIRLQNRVNDKNILDLKNDINDIQSKIDELNNQTNFYKNNYMMIKEEIKNLKDQSKMLPEVINNIENENKFLANTQIKINSNINQIKYKLFELEKNKRNIERTLNQVKKLY